MQRVTWLLVAKLDGWRQKNPTPSGMVLGMSWFEKVLRGVYFPLYFP